MKSLLFFIFFLAYFQSHSQSDTIRILNDLIKITQTPQFRHAGNPHILNQVADYIFSELKKTCDTVYFQTYKVNGIEYKNVVGSIGINNFERIIIGAHYDVCYNQEGADDNASGVAGVLELSRMLKNEQLNYRIDFVAYSLEEPPHFKTENMGSYIHAKSIFDDKIEIKGMICFDMIGYFSNEPNSQEYPVKFLKWFYGTKGNYITVVQKFGNGGFGRKIKRYMKQTDEIKTKSFKAPKWVPGVDFSDHLNYWKFNYPAIMITNTAFYRNKNYHKTTDTLETLNLMQMSNVINEVFYSIKKLK